PNEWTRWIRRFERFRIATELDKKEEAKQVNALIYTMGDEADDIISAKFNVRIQDENEPVESCITDLHCLAKKYGKMDGKPKSSRSQASQQLRKKQVNELTSRQETEEENIKYINNENYSQHSSRLLRHEDKTTTEEIFVVKGLERSLLGRQAAHSLNLLNCVDALNSNEMKESVKEKYPNLFTGLGQIKDQEYDIKVTHEATPFAITVPRQVPIPLRKETERELQRMERNGVISRVEDPTEWCAPMVVTPKSNGKVRVCVDLTKLNQFVQRENHPLPTTDTTFANLAGARYFTKLDANSGFWQIKLSERSKPLTTFITPWGRYCFNVLPFGISSGSEKFQKFHGATQEEHDRRLEAVLQRLGQIPIRELLVKNTAWTWGPPQQDAFDKIKKALTSAPILTLYDPNKATKIAADASSYGLGAVVLQEEEPDTWKPVSFISRSMTTTEARYAQIEKEALATSQFLAKRKIVSCSTRTRLVIPSRLQRQTLNQIHEGHQGISKCRERAKISVWWPGLSAQIKVMVENCTTCSKYRQQHPDPLMPTPLPQRPWQLIATDLFILEKVTYLLVVDYYSRYVEVVALPKSTSSSKITQALKTIFARHGIPDEVRSDNGPQYHSDEFAQFAKEWGFKHSTSSPRYPQANGEVERAVKTVKNILKKEQDPTKALLAYRSTPLASGYSPAEVLMGRKIKSTIPITLPHLTPQLPNQKLFIEKEEVYRSKQKKNFDNRHKAQPLKPLPPGATVYITDMDCTGTIIRPSKKPRSYLVDTPTTVVKRNRLQFLYYQPISEHINDPSHIFSNTEVVQIY
ncbi:Transposon Ty3-G Gag-Pol poly, partial [Paramuricea clavata]